MLGGPVRETGLEIADLRRIVTAPSLTSPRLRGEVGSHRRCDPGEGESPRIRVPPSARSEPLTLTLSPRKGGERGRWELVTLHGSRRLLPRGREDAGQHQRKADEVEG